jgi:hypothetical protein
VCECAPADTSIDYVVDTAADTGTEPAPDPVWDTLDEDVGTDPVPDTAVDSPDEPDAATGGIVGDPCTSDTDCSGVPRSPVCLTGIMGSLTFPGGYCSGDCTGSADCGPGANCVTVVSSISYCLKRCTVDSDCRESEGYACITIFGSDYCMPSV